MVARRLAAMMARPLADRLVQVGWRTRRWTGSGTVKRRCRSLTTGAVSLQLGRRRLGQKNRVDEKVFVECNIQKESKVKSEKWKVKSEKWKVKSEKSKVKSQKSKVKSQKSKVKSEKSKVKSQKWKGGSWRMEVPVYVSNIYFSIFLHVFFFIRKCKFGFSLKSFLENP